jgi:hypothetical protein
MSLLMHTRFGGRQKRYREIPKTLVEFTDPWERRKVAVAGEWQRDLWLVCRADPAVVAIVERPPALHYLYGGQRHRAVADFAVSGPRGLTHHTLLLEDSFQALLREETLLKAAQAHRVSQRVWRLTDLQARSLLIQNMAHVRQCLVVWLDEDLTKVQHVIASALVNGTHTRRELRGCVEAALGQGGVAGIDASLFRLHFERRILIDLNERYDDESQIALG